MPRGRKKTGKANPRLPHNKDTFVQVGFNDDDARDLDLVVETETAARIVTNPKFGRATVIREHAMPSIHQRAEEYRAGLNNAERRNGAPERRHPETDLLPTT